MKDRLGVSSRDIVRLLAAADRQHVKSGVDGIPMSVLEAVCDLVPCNVVSYKVDDYRDRRPLLSRDFGDPYAPLERDPVRQAEVSARMIASSLPCTYQYRTSEHTAVYRSTDFYGSQREYWASPYGEWAELVPTRFTVQVPLTLREGRTHRLILWRDEGRNFTDREALLLQMLRPHLLELEQLAYRGSDSPPLTSRQREVLGLVAQGLTNRGIARHLDLSEGTVRTHMMHIFAALSVQSRAAAVAWFIRPQ